MESSPEQKTMPLDYARVEGSPKHDRRLAVLLMYILPTIASMICFWHDSGKIGSGIRITGCFSAGPFLWPLVLHYKRTDFLFTVAGPATGLAVLVGWLALAMWTPLRRVPPLIHLTVWAAWMVVGNTCVFSR
jgi:hypothetical protein